MTTPAPPRRQFAWLFAVLVLAAMAVYVTRARADAARDDKAEHDTLCFAFPASPECP